MDAQKIDRFVNSYFFLCTATPGGTDGNLLTNYVDDKPSKQAPEMFFDGTWADDGEDENDISMYSDEELYDRFKKLLELYEKKKQDQNMKGITPESDEIPELTKDMGRAFFGVDLGYASK